MSNGPLWYEQLAGKVYHISLTDDWLERNTKDTMMRLRQAGVHVLAGV